ncbi:hypothetical protein GF108_12295 [Phyllobacterium sp. SYP-B3895]|uniref:hypothetical protein n=1 Tax=Phyllobacterium sp. SYP-B3895 TaxID=2663240 RepID=UPI001299CC64|nr:hypothetical protein [Phyllobacterium sp. SYP-B3895]MRG56359.1 hypothetical protein [Phyllobacterium sp. SYP-B3895]
MVETGEKSAKAGAFGWGIIGSGESARRFASDLSLLPDAALVANHSRMLSSAEKFRETFGSASAYADLDSSSQIPPSTPSTSQHRARCISHRR